MTNETIVRKQAKTDSEWEVMDKDEIKKDWGLPSNWEILLTLGEILYSDKYVYRLERTPYVEYPEDVEINGKLIFTNNMNGKQIEWTLETAEKTMSGYGHNLKGRLVAGEIIDMPLGTLKLVTT